MFVSMKILIEAWKDQLRKWHAEVSGRTQKQIAINKKINRTLHIDVDVNLMLEFVAVAHS